MEVINYEYSKLRKDFGKYPTFSDANDVFAGNDPSIRSAGPASDDARQWVESVVTTVELDCVPLVSEHTVSTKQFTQANKSTSHQDGAWPLDVKTSIVNDKIRAIRVVTGKIPYQVAVVQLTKQVEELVRQNNTIDVYEKYFDGVVADHTSSPPSSKTVAVFKDPHQVKRSATNLCWHPDGNSKVAVAYSVMSFQQMPANMPVSSYIWDLNNPNEPDAEVIPPSPLVNLVYNPRTPDHLLGGCYNGLLCFWDLRKGPQPVETSAIETSHHDAVNDVFWVQSRSGYECCSCSSDGQVLWWDVRKLGDGPMDSMMLKSADGAMIYGASRMEYVSDAGATKYLLGTEQGYSLLADRKVKKDSESQKAIKTLYGGPRGKHHGPIYGIQRNPFHFKYFLTAGDWTARIWNEELKACSIMSTPYDTSYLTSCAWSTTRPALFFTTTLQGQLQAWDYYQKQNEPTYTTKVGDSGLCSIKVHKSGKLLGLGSLDGTTSILELSEGLVEPQPQEKLQIASVFERETRREKNLDMSYIQRERERKEKDRKAARADQRFDPNEIDNEETQTQLRRVEDEFTSLLSGVALADEVETDSDEDDVKGAAPVGEEKTAEDQP